MVKAYRGDEAELVTGGKTLWVKSTPRESTLDGWIPVPYKNGKKRLGSTTTVCLADGGSLDDFRWDFAELEQV